MLQTCSYQPLLLILMDVTSVNPVQTQKLAQSLSMSAARPEVQFPIFKRFAFKHKKQGWKVNK